jgi:hypothetical protein
MAEFTETILARLESGDASPRQRDLREYVQKIRQIQAAVRKLGFNADIESILTVLQGRSDPKKALAEIGPILNVFLADYQGLAPEKSASVAVTEIEDMIYSQCSQLDTNKAIELYEELWDYLSANLAVRANGGLRVIGPAALQKIFTTNYDRSLETFLVRRGISFSDGFQSEGVDHVFTGQWGPGGTNLYKLHGSVNYYKREDGKIVRSDAPLGSVDAYNREIKGRMMIYPVGEKYASRSPFYEYLGQLRAALLAETACIVIGYSFRDPPINHAFVDAIPKNRKLQIVVLGPSATEVVERLDASIQNNVMAVNGTFGTKGSLAPQNIVDALKSWRPPLSV